MGRNSRLRKEKKILEKYGELPKEPVKIAWGKVVATILVVTLCILGAKDLYSRSVPKIAGWLASRGQTAATPQPSQSTDQEQQQMTATISTNQGDIKLELFAKDAPKTVENFKKLAEKNYYEGVIFHRVIEDFMIQGGDPTGTGTGGESAFGGKFEDEINAKSLGLSDDAIRRNEGRGYKYRTDLQSHKMEAGVIAMANAGPNTNGSQFFIVHNAAQPHLDGLHTVFGKVTEGMDVVNKIASTEVDGSDKPISEVKINKVTIEEK